MQVVVGTLESLARDGAASAPRKDGDSGGDGADSVRVDGLETQVRAMAAQIEQLSQQVRALGGQPRADAKRPADALPPDTPLAKPGPARCRPLRLDDGHGGDRRRRSRRVRQRAAGGAPGTAPAARPAAPGEHAPGSQPPGAAGACRQAAAAGAMQDTAAAIAPPRRDAGNPKQLYETAYGYLMQRDYGAAQTAFEDFLTRYPKDSLAGNAQYWLGEAHFVRGEYKAAAGAFLKGYQNYAGNARAADSLLKLAMSLDRLGQKDAACSSYSELSTRFPDAPDNVKMRAKSERQRIGCP